MSWLVCWLPEQGLIQGADVNCMYLTVGGDTCLVTTLMNHAGVQGKGQ